MGLQSNEWHSKYFSLNSTTKYNDQYQAQELSKKEEKENKILADNVKKAYKLSENLYSDALLDSKLLSRVINDPGFNVFDVKTKNLILQSKLKCLKPLLVNAKSASREALLQEYIEEKNIYAQKLAELSSPKQQKKPLSINIPLSKITAESEAQEDSEHGTAVHMPVHENSSTESTQQLASAVEFRNKSNDKITEKEKVESWFECIINFLKNLFILSPVTFVKWIGELNLYRLSYTFSRISWKGVWTYLKSIGILDTGNKLHGVFVNISMMDYPTQVFNILSVLIFVLKLSLNLILPFKHAFDPTSRAELAFNWRQRFMIQVNKVWDTNANDLFWMIFNGITNFPLMFGLSIPVANWILTGALLFDILLLSRVLYLEEKSIANELIWLDQELKDAKSSDNEPYINMYEAMIKHAKIMRAGNRAIFISCIVATVFFITSLALILSLTTPLMAPLGFFICFLAVAVILARNDIGKYAEAKVAQNLYKDQDGTKEIRAEEARKAGWQLAKSLFEHIFIPMFIIGLYAINWPAAIAFTAIYICIKASGVKLTSNDKPKNLESEEHEEHEENLCLITPSAK